MAPASDQWPEPCPSWLSSWGTAAPGYIALSVLLVLLGPCAAPARHELRGARVKQVPRHQATLALPQVPVVPDGKVPCSGKCANATGRRRQLSPTSHSPCMRCDRRAGLGVAYPAAIRSKGVPLGLVAAFFYTEFYRNRCNIVQIVPIAVPTICAAVEVVGTSAAALTRIAGRKCWLETLL